MYRLSRLKPRASKKMRGLIMNNKDPFSFFGNRPPRPGLGNMIFSGKQDTWGCPGLFFALHQISAKNYVICGSDDLFFVFYSSKQCHLIASGLSYSKSGPELKAFLSSY